MTVIIKECIKGKDNQSHQSAKIFELVVTERCTPFTISPDLRYKTLHKPIEGDITFINQFLNPRDLRTPNTKSYSYFYMGETFSNQLSK